MVQIKSKTSGDIIEVLEVYVDKRFDEKIIRFKEKEIVKQWPFGLFESIYRDELKGINL